MRLIASVGDRLMSDYDFAAIETKWQAFWADNETFRQANPGDDGFDAF